MITDQCLVFDTDSRSMVNGMRDRGSELERHPSSLKTNAAAANLRLNSQLEIEGVQNSQRLM